MTDFFRNLKNLNLCAQQAYPVVHLGSARGWLGWAVPGPQYAYFGVNGVGVESRNNGPGCPI